MIHQLFQTLFHHHHHYHHYYYHHHYYHNHHPHIHHHHLRIKFTKHFPLITSAQTTNYF